jgi:hypothetical protein
MKFRTHILNLFRSRRGFNLVELALATAVTAIGIVSVFGILPHLMKASRQAVDYNAITIDIQDFIDDPSHRGTLTTTNLQNTTYFPTLASPYVASIESDNLRYIFTFATHTATNADTSYSSDLTQYTNELGHPMLKTLYITYTWGNTNNAATRQSYTFISETCASRVRLNPVLP